MLCCSRLVLVPNGMKQHAADNKHDYHAIYQHIPLGGRTITQSLRLRLSGAELTLEGLPWLTQLRFSAESSQTSNQGSGDITFKQVWWAFWFLLYFFWVQYFLWSKAKDGELEGKSARRWNPSLQNSALPSSGSRIECLPQTGSPWQNETNRSNGSSRDAPQTKETGPAPSPLALVRQLWNGASMGLWLRFADRNHRMNITAYLPFHMLMAWMPSLGKAVQEAYPKRMCSFCHPFLHISCFPFKSPVNHSI